MRVTTWLAVLAVVLLGLGLMAVLVWAGRSKRSQRRKARVVHEIAAAYRRERTTNTEAGRSVTVAELVARIEHEGLPVRLRWEREDEGGEEPGDGEWPTGVMGRV